VSSKAPIGRALGLGGSSHTHHWWLQRVGALALLPLAIWFACALLGLPDVSYATAHGWLARPVNALLMLLTLIVVAHHSWIGVGVILEDYVHRKSAKIVLMLASQYLHLALAVAGCFAVLRVALGSGA
jgi:succinate dehydrogenase / fumarate reductase membrane anchor subunit